MKIRNDLSEKRFGNAVALDCVGKINGTNHWRCICDCGEYFIARVNALTTGNTKSCGCFHKKQASEKNTKHGQAKKTITYNSWVSMRKRCYEKSDVSFDRYGGRGIKVCARWKNSFENFFADMGERPQGKTLDRKDNDGNYEPGNCRWATYKQQRHNRGDS